MNKKASIVTLLIMILALSFVAVLTVSAQQKSLLYLRVDTIEEYN